MPLKSAALKLNQIITEYGLIKSVQKIKSMAFKGGDPVRTKIVIDNKIIIFHFFFFFFAVALRPNAGHGLLILEVSR